MKTYSSCGRIVADEDGLELTDGRFFCKSGGCQKSFLDRVVDEEVIPDIIASGGKVVRMVDSEKPAIKNEPVVIRSGASQSSSSCEGCHKVQVAGDYYRFYYGRKTGSSFLNILSPFGYNSPPVIKDQASVWICRKCTGQRKAVLYGLMGLLLILSLLLIAAYLLNPSASILFLPVAAFSLAGLLFMFERFLGKNEISERLAIRFRKHALREQGYNIFLTNKQFARLR